MAQDSKIEWTHHTANLWWGCNHVHAGCDHCYAEAWSKRYAPTSLWGEGTPRMEVKGVWKDLAKYQRLAAAAGEVHRVFVGSMMDIFEKSRSIIDRNGEAVDSLRWEDDYLDVTEIRMRFFLDIVPASPNLLFLLLTKRPSNINKYIPESWKDNPPANVMFGTSPVDQATFDNLTHHLRQVNGRRFLSVEPQLGPIVDPDLTGIDWVINGGESGPKRRPFNLDWARDLREACHYQGVPYFFKQVDKALPIPDDLMIRQFPN